MSDPRYPNDQTSGLNRVSESMIIPNIIQFLQVEGTDAAGATLRGGINFKHADGASGDSITFIATDDSGNDVTDMQLQFNAVLEDLEDVTKVGAAAGHMMVYNDATDKYHSRPITGHVTVGTGGVATISVDVVGITNLNVATHGASGHILFNNDGGLDFIAPELDHLLDVSQDGNVISGHILVHNGTVFQNKAVSGDVTMSNLGVITIGDNKIGWDELNISSGVNGQVLGTTGDALAWYSRTIDITEITGPDPGITAIMVHDGTNAVFQDHVELPDLGIKNFNVYGQPGDGVVSPAGTQSAGKVLGVTGRSGGGFAWSWLDIIELGTGATGISQLAEISFDGTVENGDFLVGAGGYFANKKASAGSSDIAINASGPDIDFTIKAGVVENSMLDEDGITLSAGDGLVYNTGNETIDLGETAELKVDVDNSTIDIAGGKIQVKLLGIDTSQLTDGAVTSNKIEDEAVTTVKIPDDAVTNDKILNPRMYFTGDSGTNAIQLGGTETIAGDGAISTIQSASTLTISVDTANTSSLGVAKFASNDFDVAVDGEVTIDTVNRSQIADDAIDADKIDDGVVGLDELNTFGSEGSTGDVLIRGSGQGFGFVSQASIYTETPIGLDDLTDVTWTSGASGVMEIIAGASSNKDVLISDNTKFVNRRLTVADIDNISNDRLVGNVSGSASAPSQITKTQLVTLLNSASGLDADLLGGDPDTEFARLNEINTFSKKITVDGGSAVTELGTVGVMVREDSSGGWARGYRIGSMEPGTDDQGTENQYGQGTFGGYGDSNGKLVHLYISARPGAAPYTTTADIVIKKDTGNVGIHDDTPSYTLDVNGSFRSVGETILASDGSFVSIGSTNSPHAPLMIKPSNTSCRISLDYSDATSNYGFIEFSDGNGTAGAPRSIIVANKDKMVMRCDGYFKWSDEDEQINLMHLTSTGKLGIGLDTPAAPLTIKSSGNGWDDGIRIIDSTTTNYYDIVYDDMFKIGYNGSTKLTLDTGGDVELVGKLVIPTNTDGLWLGGGDMILDAQGSDSAIYMDVPDANHDNPDEGAGSRIGTHHGYGNLQILCGANWANTAILTDGFSEIEMSESGPIFLGGTKYSLGVQLADPSNDTGIKIVPSTSDSSSYVKIVAGWGDGYLDLSNVDKVKYGNGVEWSTSEMPESPNYNGIFYTDTNMASTAGSLRYYNIDLSTVRAEGANCVQIDWHDVDCTNVGSWNRLDCYLGYSGDSNDNADDIYTVNTSWTKNNDLSQPYGTVDAMVWGPNMQYPYNDWSNNPYIPLSETIHPSTFKCSGWFRIHNMQRHGSSDNKYVWFEYMNFNQSGNYHYRITARGTGCWYRAADITNWQMYWHHSSTDFESGWIQARTLY